jgi:hypothetical protein
MNLRRIQRLTSKAIATLVAVAVVLGQPLLPACACAASSADGCCAAQTEPSCCGGDRCRVAASSCCCDSQPFGEGVQCSCWALSDETPASTASNPVRVVDVEAGSLLLPAPTVAAHAGLHGSAWATAFDLEALGGLPGLRLHALLCVWRN